MFGKAKPLLVMCFILAACASPAPKIIQTTPGSPEVRLTVGMATQVEMPSGHVQSVTVGNPALVTVERADDVVNLLAKEGTGETNLIIRSIDEDGRTNVYQYRIIVMDR